MSARLEHTRCCGGRRARPIGCGVVRIAPCCYFAYGQEVFRIDLPEKQVASDSAPAIYVMLP